MSGRLEGGYKIVTERKVMPHVSITTGASIKYISNNVSLRLERGQSPAENGDLCSEHRPPCGSRRFPMVQNSRSKQKDSPIARGDSDVEALLIVEGINSPLCRHEIGAATIRNLNDLPVIKSLGIYAKHQAIFDQLVQVIVRRSPFERCTTEFGISPDHSRGQGETTLSKNSKYLLLPVLFTHLMRLLRRGLHIPLEKSSYATSYAGLTFQMHSCIYLCKGLSVSGYTVPAWLNRAISSSQKVATCAASTDRLVGPLQNDMVSKHPKPQKDSRSAQNTPDEKEIHFVCHDCAHLEGVSNWMAFAQAVGRAHELDTGHSVSVERVDG